MRFVAASILLSTFLMVGCTADSSAGDEDNKQVGRYAYYPPAGEMPGILLDTVTGCTEIFVPLVDTENPEVVYWAREYSGAPLVMPSEDGSQYGPPMRCPEGAPTPARRAVANQ